MLKKLGKIYMIDLICNVILQPYYEKLGMLKATGMMSRNYKMKSGS
ncbi:acetyltransferase [Jeotgalibacillus soli]|uniref:Acetyltransferase n=1 Tax=Jeotgalibacillus soli TaxID=889306 RepID=A0A0C2VM16_9BACL|nr:acetyltransferase [Jeotgalibacillus soli]